VVIVRRSELEDCKADGGGGSIGRRSHCQLIIMHIMNPLCCILIKSKQARPVRVSLLTRETGIVVHSSPAPLIERKTSKAAPQRLRRERFTDIERKGWPKPPFFMSGRKGFHKENGPENPARVMREEEHTRDIL
jgi:hypothetical protein